MKFRRAMRLARIATFSAILTAGVANAGPVVNAGYDLFESLTGATLGGVAFQGVPIGTFNFGGTIGVKNVLLIDADDRLAAHEYGAHEFWSRSRFLVHYASKRSRRAGQYGLHDDRFWTGSPSGFAPRDLRLFLRCFFDVRLGSLGGPIALSDTLRLTSNGVPWNHFPPANGLEIPCVNVFLNGTDRNADFFPIGQFQEVHPTGAVHRVTEATTPEHFSGGFARSSPRISNGHAPPLAGLGYYRLALSISSYICSGNRF